MDAGEHIVPAFMGHQNEQQRGGEGNPLQEHFRLFKQKIHRSTDRSVVSLIGPGPQGGKDRRQKEADGQDPFREGSLLEFVVRGEMTVILGWPCHNRQLSAADRLVIASAGRNSWRLLQ